MKTKVLIIGAGITGLSTAYHMEKLGKKDYIVAERGPACGGLCASVRQDGFTFDYSGHVIHTQNPYTRDLLKKLLGKNTNLVKRRAWIYVQDTLVPFPFQANLSYLKEDVVAECVSRLMKASKQKKKKTNNFKEWALSVYGEGICKYFMLPYNEKLWQINADELSTTWCSTFVPKTNLEDIIKGAYFKQKGVFGYNPIFFYPKEGGAQALPDAMAKKVKNLLLNTEITSIDFDTKTAYTKDGQIEFEKLVNTTPLKTFIPMCKGLDKKYEKTAANLTSNKVYVLNIGINRVVQDTSWVYFPEQKYPFYRVGVQSSFSAKVAPKDCSSLYIECAFKETDKEPDLKKLQTQILTALKETGFIREEDKILTALWLKIAPAYPSYNLEREVFTGKILTALGKYKCVSAGRYGAWEYSFIEKSILEGKEIAEKL
ncbi:protoporphyrinogen oxidase [Elusimicrobium posterum]|uniref:protoporphyrinogen/coproporphyrinogen oxidase n=1 Tax=Elusimicrobium posterum TaxID=3116653 RepID=UPI003C72584B